MWKNLLLISIYITNGWCDEVVQCDRPIEDGDIDESLNQYEQDDPQLIEILKSYYVTAPPKDLEYNLPRERLTPFYLQGQFGQADIVDKFYNGNKTDGFFVEAGAYDGVIVSNTLFFELTRGWTGLLVEANPDSYEELLTKNRKVWSVGQCLSTKRTPEIVVFDAASIFGGILQDGRAKPGDNIPITNRETMKKNVEKTRKFIRMQCFPLYSLLLAVGNPTVDYLSLDIEGAEVAVLRSIPWDKVDIRVISLEVVRGKLNDALEEDHVDPYPDMLEILESHGYKEFHSVPHTPEKISYESFFVRKDLLP